MKQTIGQVQSALRQRLVEAGLTSAALEVDWMIEHVTGLSRARILAGRDQDLGSDAVGALESMVRRREAREPLQYILGETGFYGRTFVVTPDVLIPRPETELLVETALRVLGRDPKRVLDIGTGSGCIACSLALEAPAADIHAVDVSPAAIAIARKNALLLDARVHFAVADLFDSLAMGSLPAPFDLIVSNPPYVPDRDAPSLEPELGFEPQEALFTRGSDLRFVHRLAELSQSLLGPGGVLLQEIHAPEADGAVKVLSEAGFGAVEVFADLAGRPRVVSATLATA